MEADRQVDRNGKTRNKPLGIDTSESPFSGRERTRANPYLKEEFGIPGPACMFEVLFCC
jgi:hypothetical protein